MSKYKYLISFISFLIFFILLVINFDLMIVVVNFFVSILENKNHMYLFSSLFSIIIIMGMWIIYFFINLKKTNDILKKTLNELNFQKMALDEHAILSITDTKGNITYVNKKFCETSGYDEKELIGKNHRIVKSDEHSKEFFSNLKETIKNGKVWNGEVKNKKKNGDFYWVRATIVPFLDLNGKPNKYISIRTDITEMKNAEIELIKAKHIAEESNKTKSDFLANMSHELKTPLNSINLISSVMVKNKDKKLDKNQIKNLSIINRCGKDLLFLINDVLDISKLDAGEIKVNCETINFKDFIFNIKDMFENQILEKNLKFNLEYDENITSIFNDEIKIKQILVNFLSNAIKFTNKGEISLIIKDEDSYVSIIVEDNGIGIANNKLNDIFDRFKQVDSNTTRRYGGTGLGLAISKELATLINGEIFVSSVLKKGTKFTLKCEKNFTKNDNNKYLPVLLSEDYQVEEEKEHSSIINSDILILNDNPIALFDIFIELKRKAKSIKLVNNMEIFNKTILERDYNKIIINITENIIFEKLNFNDYSKELYIICNNNLKFDDITVNDKEIIFIDNLNKDDFLSKIN